MLALICGTGALPAAVAAAAPVRPLVCVLDGFAPEGLTPDLVFRLETLGSLLADLGARGVTEVCLCGAIRRPVVDPSLIDARTAPLVPRIAQALALGDDGALRVVMELFQEQGITPRAAHEVAPDLLPPSGVLTSAQPAPEVLRDVALGDAVLREMAAADLGQACVIGQGRVIARESDAGTDALLSGLPAGGAFLFKAPKPGQDRRADLPVIGPGTVALAQAAGLSGLVIEAGGVMVLDRSKVLEALEQAGLFLWVRAGAEATP